jgi:Fe-S cluster assembly protein SufD
VSSLRAALAALPDTRHEDWRYTDLAPLKARTWPGESEEKGSDPFSFDGAEPRTLDVQLQGLLTHRIALRPNQQATLVLHEVPCHPERSEGSLAFHNLEIDLPANAQLTLYRIQQPGAATSLISRLDARLARDARFTCVGLYAGGALVRNDLNVSLDAPGARAELHGVLAPAAGEHLDVHTRLDHRAPHGTSREAFRCLVPAKARAIFNGKVIVHPQAQKTDSEQHVDSLLLAPGAEVNAKPELEIYADDVKCAHGATCGQLDEEVLYYLRTRGLDLAAARSALLRSFAFAVLDRIALPDARALAARVLEARL